MIILFIRDLSIMLTFIDLKVKNHKLYCDKSPTTLCKRKTKPRFLISMNYSDSKF